MRVRNSKGRFVSEKTLVDRVDELKRAGFTVSYAWRDDAARFGYLNSCHLSGEYSGGYKIMTVSGVPSSIYGEPYVSLEQVAMAECSYGQSSTVHRSNYAAIRRDYPQFPWVDTSYLNVDALGIFVADLDDDMTGLLIGLAEQYPVYDEQEMSRIEQDEIEQSWSGYMRSEIWRELPEVTRTVMWDAIGDEGVTGIWWACVADDVFGNYPEHHGVEVVWGDVAKRAADFRPYLIHAYVSIRQGGILPAEWEWVPMVHRFIRDREAGKIDG